MRKGTSSNKSDKKKKMNRNKDIKSHKNSHKMEEKKGKSFKKKKIFF